MNITSPKQQAPHNQPLPESGEAPPARPRRKRDPERAPPSLRRWAKADTPQAPEATRFKRDW